VNDIEAVPKPEVFVSFIRDEPAEEDFFQTHGRLAKAIAGAIRTNPELRVVGLLGRWGSGKSTVVEHLKRELGSGAAKGAGAVHIFSYDAWLHQSDPVRRSFLESLLRFLIEGDWTSAETWEEQLLELTGQVEKTDVKQTPILTNDAKWIFLSLLPVPIAVGLGVVAHA
jgi:predicted KAP-like P-loop ATPase